MQKCFFYECKMESFHQLRLPKEPTLAVGHKRKLKPNAVLTVFHTRRLNVTDWQAKKEAARNFRDRRRRMLFCWDVNHCLWV